MTKTQQTPLSEVDELRRRLGQEIRHARQAAHVSQVELSTRTGLKQTTISEYERAVTRPSLDVILAIEDALGLCRGALLVAAGYVVCPTTAEDAVRADPAIDAIDEELLLHFLARARTRHHAPAAHSPARAAG